MPHIQITVDEETLADLVKYAAQREMSIEEYAADCLRFMGQTFEKAREVAHARL